MTISFENGIHSVANPEDANRKMVVYCMNNQMLWPHDTDSLGDVSVPKYLNGYLKASDFDSEEKKRKISVNSAVASFEYKPLLIPCIMADPANAPKIALKSNASLMIFENTTGRYARLMIITITEIRMYATPMAGTNVDVFHIHLLF